MTTAAELIKQAATKSERFGDQAYIASVYENCSMFRGSLRQFKALVIEAWQNGELELCRADLVTQMDRALIAKSETEYLNARFHMIRL